MVHVYWNKIEIGKISIFLTANSPLCYLFYWERESGREIKIGGIFIPSVISNWSVTYLLCVFLKQHLSYFLFSFNWTLNGLLLCFELKYTEEHMGKKEEGDSQHENVMLKSEYNKHWMNLIIKVLKYILKVSNHSSILAST